MRASRVGRCGVLSQGRPVSGNWVRARYVAERDVIAARYAEWELCGLPEMRQICGGSIARSRTGQLTLARTHFSGFGVSVP
jgi:hypothetical protein